MPSSSTLLYKRKRTDVFDRVKTLKLLGLTTVLGLAIILTCTLSLLLGAKAIDATTVFNSLFHGATGSDSLIILESRLPRTLAGLVCGSALAVSGTLIQALTRNAMADPGILGVNSGASFFILIGIVFFDASGIQQYIWFAFAGSLVTALMVFTIGSSNTSGMNPVRLILAGVALSAVMSGISSGISLLNITAYDQMRFWEAGSLDVRNLKLTAISAIPVILGLILAFIVAQPLNNIGMGEEVATSLGTSVRTTQFFCLIAITLLCGGATALAGPIGFVGLMVPHFSRWLVGNDQRHILFFSMLLGPLLVLNSDIVGRLIVNSELRVSVVTAFIGAPLLILLIRKNASFGKL